MDEPDDGVVLWGFRSGGSQEAGEQLALRARRLLLEAPSIRFLDLTGNMLAAPSVALLCATLGAGACPGLRSLELAQNRATRADLAPVFRHTGLQLLDLRANQLDLDDAARLAPHCRASTTLRSLDLRDNPLGRDGLEVLEPALAGHATLRLGVDAEDEQGEGKRCAEAWLGRQEEGGCPLRAAKFAKALARRRLGERPRGSPRAPAGGVRARLQQAAAGRWPPERPLLHADRLLAQDLLLHACRLERQLQRHDEARLDKDRALSIQQQLEQRHDLEVENRLHTLRQEVRMQAEANAFACAERQRLQEGLKTLEKQHEAWRKENLGRQVEKMQVENHLLARRHELHEKLTDLRLLKLREERELQQQQEERKRLQQALRDLQLTSDMPPEIFEACCRLEPPEFPEVSGDVAVREHMQRASVLSSVRQVRKSCLGADAAELLRALGPVDLEALAQQFQAQAELGSLEEASPRSSGSSTGRATHGSPQRQGQQPQPVDKTVLLFDKSPAPGASPRGAPGQTALGATQDPAWGAGLKGVVDCPS